MAGESAAQLAATVVSGGFVLGAVFGALAQKTNFCTMGAVSDIVNMGHWGRMRLWALALAVAIVGTAALTYQGSVDIGASVYQRPSVNWLSLVLGGLLFGIGMSMAGGCANKNLVRLGGGSVRSLVVLVFLGLTAYISMKGLFAQWRVSFLDPVAVDLTAWGWKDQSLATALARATGLDSQTALLALATVIALCLAIFALSDRRFRAHPWHWLGGLGLGLTVVAGWYLTGHLGYGENPETLETIYFATNSRTLESLSFVAPVAYSIELLMLWTDRSLKISFGVAVVLGVIVGSTVVALISRSFRWEGFASLADLRSHLGGAVLMGFGGVTAMGCTVGQGLSGLSTLAIGSVLAVAGIMAGSAMALKYMAWRAEQED